MLLLNIQKMVTHYIKGEICDLKIYLKQNANIIYLYCGQLFNSCWNHVFLIVCILANMAVNFVIQDDFLFIRKSDFVNQ